MSIYNIEMMMNMKFIISNSGDQPIYDRIVTQIKNLIILGELREGGTLPSLRLLAKELWVSVIMTKRAYEGVEREGFIVSMIGKGSFVAGKNLDFIREEQLRKIDEHLQRTVELSRICGVSLDELIEILRVLYKGEE